MTMYDKSDYSVTPEISALHANELDSFTQNGTWGSATQRAAIASTARNARSAAGLQIAAPDGENDLSELPDAALELARELALGGTAIDRDYFKRITGEGVTEGAYVEIVSVVSRLVNLDVFARGIGMSPQPLGNISDLGKPSFERPKEAIDEGFFTASIPSAPAGGAIAESLYGESPAGNILRSLSLVPAEARRVIDLVANQYFSGPKFMDLAGDTGYALSRAQIEVVASKVSAHNRCFY